jgi:hypothetical protein
MSYGAAGIFALIGLLLLVPPIRRRMPFGRAGARSDAFDPQIADALTELSGFIDEGSALARGLKGLGVTHWATDWPPEREGAWPHYAGGYMPMVYEWRDKLD